MTDTILKHEPLNVNSGRSRCFSEPRIGVLRNNILLSYNNKTQLLIQIRNQMRRQNHLN